MSSIWTIRRSTDDAKIAGVCGGVARHWNVDPVLVRVGWVLLALSAGIGLVLYAAGWLLVPADGKDKAVIHDLLGDQAGRLSRELWIAIVVLACIVGAAVFGSISPFGLGPAVILALIWYFGYYRTKARRTPPPSRPADHPAVVPPPAAQPTEFYRFSGPATPFTQAADAWRERILQVQRETSTQNPVSGALGAGAPGAGAERAGAPVPPRTWTYDDAEDRTEPAGWARPPEPTDEQAYLAHPDPVGLYAPAAPAPAPAVAKQADRPAARRLRLIGLIALGLTLGGLAIADSAGIAVPAVVYLASALLVIGLVLIAATWFGRARGLLPVGIVLALVTAGVASAPHVAPPTQWNPQQISYATVAELPAAGDRFEVASATVDLSRVRLTEDATYKARLDLGQLTVTVPPDTNVVLDYRIDAGTVDLLGEHTAGGTDLHQTIPAPGNRPGQPTLTLDLTVDVGQIEVNR